MISRHYLNGHIMVQDSIQRGSQLSVVGVQAATDKQFRIDHMVRDRIDHMVRDSEESLIILTLRALC